jgi:hypothetical protein
MLKRPSSPDGISWYVYKARRKIHVLRTRNIHESEIINRTHSDSGRLEYLSIFFNSTGIFLFSYLIIYVLKEIVVVIAANGFNINTVIMYFDVDFLIRSKDWTNEAVKVVYSVEPLFTLILGFIALIFFSLAGKERWIFRLIMMWIFLQAFTQSLGAMIFGILLNQEFGWVLSYLYFDDTTKLLMVIGLVLGMLVTGLFLSRFLLTTGNMYFNFLNRGNKMQFLISQILLPFIVGTGIIALIKQPLLNFLEVFSEGSMLLIICPAIIYARYSQELFFDEEPREIKVNWRWIVASLLMLILFRVYFGIGVRL